MAAYINQLSLDHLPWRWSLEFDYDPALVAAIKECIPSRQRKWVPERRQWYFKDGALASVDRLCRKHCRDVRFGEPKPGREAARLQRRLLQFRQQFVIINRCDSRLYLRAA